MGCAARKVEGQVRHDRRDEEQWNNPGQQTSPRGQGELGPPVCCKGQSNQYPEDQSLRAEVFCREEREQGREQFAS